MSITRKQAEDLANFWRTITPANAAEQAIVDKLTADEDAFINQTATILESLSTPAVTDVSVPADGTVTSYSLFSQEDLRSAGCNGKTRC